MESGFTYKNGEWVFIWNGVDEGPLDGDTPVPVAPKTPGPSHLVAVAS